jgi:RES domain-containing protein
VILWRIAAETRKYGADDLSGAGASKSPGRWNDDGQPALYTAPTIAIAVLETAAHVDDSGLPLDRYLVQIDVPDAAWAARDVMDVSTLPITWAAIPAGRVSVQAGADWLRGMTALILEVPSVIVPEEPAALLNPLHADAKKLSAKAFACSNTTGCSAQRDPVSGADGGRLISRSGTSPSTPARARPRRARAARRRASNDRD